jgi:hypothetical protein
MIKIITKCKSGAISRVVLITLIMWVSSFASAHATKILAPIHSLLLTDKVCAGAIWCAANEGLYVQTTDGGEHIGIEANVGDFSLDQLGFGTGQVGASTGAFSVRTGESNTISGTINCDISTLSVTVIPGNFQQQLSRESCTCQPTCP